MSTAKQIGLTLEEFWDMNPIVFNYMIGYYLEAQGKENPYKTEYIDD